MELDNKKTSLSDIIKLQTKIISRSLKMQEHYTPKNKHLTLKERQLIEVWTSEEKSNRCIAKLLGKSHQTINNEIKRGMVLQQLRPGLYRRVYRAEYAQVKYAQNRKHSVKHIKLDKQTHKIIKYYLKKHYSPEMIVNKSYVDISVSTIYYWIHRGYLGKQKDCLIYPQKTKRNRVVQSEKFKSFGKSIDERPDYINNRSEIGHFEIDTVILTREKNQCLLTMTDRKSRYEIIRLIKDKSSKSVNEALSILMNEYEVKSLTADNGTEFAKLSDVMSKDNIYYAHPYCSQERGSNENHNRLIRRHLPKGSKNTTSAEVARIELWINQYPKRMFNYLTPEIIYQRG